MLNAFISFLCTVDATVFAFCGVAVMAAAAFASFASMQRACKAADAAADTTQLAQRALTSQRTCHERELERYEAGIDREAAKLADLEREAHRTRKIMKKMHALCDELLERNEDINGAMENVTEETAHVVDAYETRREQLEDEADTICDGIDELEQAIQTVREQTLEVRDAIEEAGDELARREAERAEAEILPAAATDDDEAAALSAEEQQFLRNALRLQARLDRLDATGEHLAAEVDRVWSGEVATLQAAVASNSAELNELNTDVELLNHRDELREHAVELTQEIGVVEGAVSEARERLEGSLRRARSAESRVEEVASSAASTAQPDDESADESA